MDANEEKKLIASWGAAAVKLMTQNGVSMMPENYFIWFEYVRGSNKKLKEAIDRNIAEKKPFTHDFSRELYANHVLKEADSKLVMETGSKIQDIMGEVLKNIESSSGETANYNKELDTFSKDLNITSNSDVKEMISSLVGKTLELKKKGEQLQKKLDESKQEVQTLKVNLEEVSAQASMDALTGISNRKTFDEKLRIMTEAAKKEQKHLCLLMVDVDHFKKFNDTYGHLLGDQVLKIVAQAMKEVVKGRDIVARYGGEEFAVVLPETPIKGGEIVAEAIRKAISSKELKRKDTGESYGTITVSIGVTTYNPIADKPEDMIARADKALYTSKKNGRNRVSVGE
jgi:diguanylate cyclase